MNKKLTKLLSVFAIAGAISVGAAFAATGCSNKPNDQNQMQTPTVTGVTVTAAGNATKVANGGTLQLSASVTGTGDPAQTVTWTVKSGATATEATVSSTGLLSAGTVAGSVTVVATSTVDTGKSGEITITVEAATQPAQPTVTGVTASADKTTATVGDTVTLTATVAGENNPSQEVTWAITAGSEYATLSGNVLTLTAAGAVKVQATSVADTTKKSDEITITAEPVALNLEVTISGETTASVGGTIQLTATVSGVSQGQDDGVVWSVDDTTVATVDENGLVTAVAPGAATVTATSKLDDTAYATHDLVITAASRYDQLANREDNLVKENFSSYTEGEELTAFDDWGTAGVYAKHGTTAEEKVKVVGGQAKALNTAKLSNMSVMVDFGSVEGVVEGYFEYQFLKTATNKGNSINFYNEGTKVLTIITNGTNYLVENIPEVATMPTVQLTCDVTAMVSVEFKFDLTNKTVTLKLNDEVVCENLACGIDNVSGFEIVTSDGGQRGIVIDNIAVCGTEMTVATYKTRVNAKVTALETKYSLAGVGYTANIKGAYTSAVEAAETFAAVDEAYDALYDAVLEMMKSQAQIYVDELWTEYTHDADKVETLKAAISAEIEAMTDLDAVVAAMTDDYADRLEAADIHPDEYYAAVDVTVVIYEKGTTTSVVKAGANLTDKDGEAFTLDQLKDAISVPEGKRIKTVYSDAECTIEITESYTLNANGATEATTVIIYVEFEDASIPLTENLLLNAETIGTGTIAKDTMFYDGTSFSVTLGGGGAVVATDTTPATASDDENLTFSEGLLPAGGSRTYTFTAKTDVTLKVYVTVTNSSWAASSGNVTLGGVAVEGLTNGTETASLVTITLSKGETATLTSDKNRLALYAVYAVYYNI